MGLDGLEEEYYYLLHIELDEIMEKYVKMILGSLCEIIIGLGELALARLGLLRDRREITPVIPILTTARKIS